MSKELFPERIWLDAEGFRVILGSLRYKGEPITFEYIRIDKYKELEAKYEYLERHALGDLYEEK